MKEYMTEVRFFGMIVTSYLADYPFMTLGEAIDALQFNDEELELVYRWVDQIQYPAYSGYLQ